MGFQISLAFHIIGAVFWIGGLMITSGLMRYFEKTEGAKSGPAYTSLTRRYLNVMVIPGLLISTASGLTQVFSRGVSFYMAQPWFHAKLTEVILLYGLTYFVWSGVQRVQQGKPVNGGKMGMIHGMIGTIFLLIVFTTFIGRA